MMPEAAPILFSGAIGLLIIGLGGMILSNHLFRMILALAIAEAGVNLMLVIAGYRWDAVAPIVNNAGEQVAMVDPVPQAMVLTAIVIGVGVQALAIAMIIRIKHTYGTLNMRELKARLEQDFEKSALDRRGNHKLTQDAS